MRNRVYIIAAVLLAIALGAVDYRLYQMADEARQDLIEHATETLNDAVQQVKLRVESNLDLYSHTLSGIAEAVAIRGGLSAQPDLFMHRLLIRRHAITPGLRVILLIRPDGTVAEYSRGFPAPPYRVEERDYFRAQLETFDTGFFIGSLALSKADQQRFFPVSVRMQDDFGRFSGVAVATMDPDELAKMLADQNLPDGFSLKLLHANGTVLACYPATDGCLDENWRESPLLKTLLPEQARRSFVSQALFNEEPGQSAYDASSKFPLVVAAVANERRLLAQWHNSLPGYVLLAVFLNLMMLYLGLYAARQFHRREMAMQALADANEQLEDRVAERTSELEKSELSLRRIIAERERAEAETLAALKRLKLATDTVELGIWVYQLSDQSLRWDERMFVIYDVPLEQKNKIDYPFWATRVHPDDLPRIESEIATLLRDGGLLQDSFRILLPGGGTRYLEVAALVEYDAAGRPLQMVGTNRDITQAREMALALAQSNSELLEHRDHLEDLVRVRTQALAQARDAAESANRAKTAFLANMSHELRTPMHHIIGFTQILQRRLSDERLLANVEHIHAGARRLSELIESILTFSSLESGSIEIEADDFSPAEVFASLNEALLPAAEAKGLQLKIELDPALPAVLHGDATRLRQVLDCLADNAVKFSEHGCVDIQAQLLEKTEADCRVRFVVADQGIGMDAAAQAGLFKLFEQLDGAYNRKYAGTGLGLVFCQRLVQLMGGGIRVDSTPGEGSHFQVDLPFRLLKTDA